MTATVLPRELEQAPESQNLANLQAIAYLTPCAELAAALLES